MKQSMSCFFHESVFIFQGSMSGESHPSRSSDTLAAPVPLIHVDSHQASQNAAAPGRAGSRGKQAAGGTAGPALQALLWALAPRLGVGTFSIGPLFSRAHRGLISMPAPEGWVTTNLKVSGAQSCLTLADPRLPCPRGSPGQKAGGGAAPSSRGS